MIICVDCLKDSEIKSIIQNLNQIGNCEICKSQGTLIYDTDQNDLLEDYFEGLLDVFQTEDKLVPEYPEYLLDSISNELLYNWNIFNNKLTSKIVDQVLKSICPEKAKEEPDFFTLRVGIPEITQPIYLRQNSIVGVSNWEEFVKSVKLEFRYHSQMFNSEVFEVFCSYIELEIKSDSIFYRSRISDENGHNVDKMSSPPEGSASAGRANPEGISYLYLGESVATTIHEIKAGQYDYVTTGKFQLKRDIKVVDLMDIDNIPAFSDLDFKQHAVNRSHLKKINDEIAKPLRRHDSHLDYIPTQYICEFIKSITDKHGHRMYDGIKYRSTMNSGGYNLAIFDKELFDCTEVKVLDIKKISYSVEGHDNLETVFD